MDVLLVKEKKKLLLRFETTKFPKMIIKFEKIINCSSEHPSYPASNLLDHRKNTSWRCAKPGEMLASVIFQLTESSIITGIDIGNYRSCVVIVTASTSLEPDTWVPVVQHQFMTNDEAANGKFKDQVQLFTKRDLNPDISKTKFDRLKITCMQSANLKELFGLMFFIAKTEVIVDLGIDVFGRFKLKQKDENNEKPEIDKFKEKCLKMIANKRTKPDPMGDLLKKVKESGMSAFSKRQEDQKEPMRRPMLEKLEAGKADEIFGKQKKISNNTVNKNTLTTDIAIANATGLRDKQSENVKRTPFGDIVPSSTPKKDETNSKDSNNVESRKRSLTSKEKDETKKIKTECPKCCKESEDRPCSTCGRLPQPKPLPCTAKVKKNKKKKIFSQLFLGISFSLSGYVNPQRDEIRRKALKMGAKYIGNPNTPDNVCTHLICAFRNTPKYLQFKNYSKIVSHTFTAIIREKDFHGEDMLWITNKKTNLKAKRKLRLIHLLKKRLIRSKKIQILTLRKFHQLSKSILILNSTSVKSVKNIPVTSFVRTSSTSQPLSEKQEVSITFVRASGERIKAKGKVGDTILDIVVNNEVDLDGYGACEGTLTCSTCHLIFPKEVYDSLPDKPTDEELDMLDLAYDLTDTSRLGCQIVMTKELDGIEVKVPTTINDARA
ncbi:LOW QUALITY PROTEIN: DNA repair protein XRCC1 [Vespula squamosa]|uniref:DNA repair protein XRCC1 n=1 Tax=Vespula squamosa TaxID=30214 RepID=A0ABD2BT40_VESSQ